MKLQVECLVRSRECADVRVNGESGIFIIVLTVFSFYFGLQMLRASLESKAFVTAGDFEIYM